METKEMNIYQKMLAITSDLKYVEKKMNVVTNAKTNTSYKAVSEVDVLDAVKPLELKYGVYSYPIKREIIEKNIIESTTQYGTKRQFYLRLEVTYRFVNVDKPDEYIEITSYGDGMDSGDKATGKAMTYADKYALMKIYKISTGEDPDKDASSEIVGVVQQVAPADLIQEYQNVRNELEKTRDIHDVHFEHSVQNKAMVNSLDPGELMADSDGLQRTIDAFKEVIEYDKKKAGAK